MNEWEELGKDALMDLWFIYITVMTIKGMFQAEEFLDIMVGVLVWACMIIIPVGIRGR